MESHNIIFYQRKMKKKLNIYLYARDSKGNQDNINKQLNRMMDYIKKEFGEADIKIYIDKGSLIEDCVALERLINDLKNEDVDWVITPTSNRFYRIKYKDGEKKLSEILNNIKKEGVNIAFSDELTTIENEDEIEDYIETLY